MPGGSEGGASKDRIDVEMLVAERHLRCVLEASARVQEATDGLMLVQDSRARLIKLCARHN
jgi:hypothetical protein